MAQKKGTQYEAVRTCMMHLAVNHEVIPDPNLNYSASSPDESALAYGARHLGFVLKTRDSHGVTVELENSDNQTDEVRVTILVTLKFNSTRKRSSVVAQFEDILPDGRKQQ